MDKLVIEDKELKINKSTWQLTKLGELATDISKRVDNPAESECDRFVGLEHFVSGDLKIKKWGSTENLGSSMKAFQAGDILFARRNTYLRRASMVEFDGCCSGDAFVIREDHEKVISGYLAFVMNSNALWDYANSNAAGTMSKRVKWRDLAEYEFLLPPKDQQAQLAELLWAMDEVIEKGIRLASSIEKSKRSFFLESRRPDKFNSLSDYASVSYGLGQPPEKNENGIAVIRATDISKGRISNDNFLRVSEEAIPKGKNVRLSVGDIIIVRSGAYTGDLAMITIDYKDAVAGYDLVIRPNRNLIDPIWLQEYLLEKDAQSYFKGESIRSAQPHLNSKQVLYTKIPMIQIEEQRIISKRLKIFYKNIELTKSKIASSKALQKSLINQIF